MLEREIVNLFHIILVAPFLIYVGLMKSKCHILLFHLLVVLGLLVFVYHSYRYLTSSHNQPMKMNNHNNTTLEMNNQNTTLEMNNHNDTILEMNNNNTTLEMNNNNNTTLEMNNNLDKKINIEMEVVDVGKKENNELMGHQPNGLFESNFASVNDNDSMNSVDGFTW